MGFGILFFAYFLTYAGGLTPIGTFTYVLGSALMLFALYKLSEQNKLFLASCISTLVLFILSFIIMIMHVFGLEQSLIYNPLVLIQGFLAPALNILVMLAIFIIAKEVELPRIQVNSIINIALIGISVICNILSLVISNDDVLARLGVVYLVSQIIYIGYSMVVIFKCYMRICSEDDKDMSNTSGGVPFFDFLNKLFNRATNKNKNNGLDNKGGKK